MIIDKVFLVGLFGLLLFSGCVVSSVKADEQNKIIANCYPLYFDENKYTGQNVCSWVMPDTNKNCVLTWHSWTVDCD